MSNKSQYSDYFNKTNLLNLFRENGLFDMKNDPLIKANLNLEEVIDFPIFSLSKKQFIKDIPSGEFSTNIYGDVVDEYGMPNGFTVKMALLTLYGSIANNVKKFTDSRETMDHILSNSPISLNEKQYILLTKLETSFGIADQLSKFINNKADLENQLKAKYSVYELAEMLSVKDFVIRTTKYSKKHAPDIHTVDLFTGDTLSERINKENDVEAGISTSTSIAMPKNESHNDEVKEFVQDNPSVVAKPEQKQETVEVPSANMADTHDMNTVEPDNSVATHNPEASVPSENHPLDIEIIKDKVQLKSELVKLDDALLSSLDKSIIIIKSLNKVSEELNTAVANNDLVMRENLLDSFALLSDKLLSVSNRFSLNDLMNTINKDGSVPELELINKVLQHKHNNESSLDWFAFDDFFDADGKPNKFTKYNLLLDNNQAVVRTIATFKNSKKLEQLYQTYLVQDATGETPISTYLKEDVVTNDFNNSFAKSLKSGRVMSGVVAKILRNPLDDETYKVVLDNIFNANDKDGYKLEEYKHLFSVVNANKQLLDDVNERVDEFVSTNPTFASQLLDSTLDAVIINHDVEGINRVMQMIKSQNLINPSIDKEFVKEAYKKALSLPDVVIKDLQISQNDLDDYQITITQKQRSKISSLKP